MAYELSEKLIPVERVGDCACFDVLDLGIGGMPVCGTRKWMCELIDGLRKRGLRFVHIEPGSVYCEVLIGAKLDE